MADMPVTLPQTTTVSQPSVETDRLFAWYIREYLLADSPAERAAICRAAQRDGYDGRSFTEAIAVRNEQRAAKAAAGKVAA